MGSLAPKIKRKTVGRDRGRVIASQREISKICIRVYLNESPLTLWGRKKPTDFKAAIF